MFVGRRLARKNVVPPPSAAGVYYDQRKELQYSDYVDRQRSRTATSTPMRFAGDLKSLRAPPPPFSTGYGRPRPPPPPPHQGRGAYLDGRSLSANAAAGSSLLYHHPVDGGVDSRYVEHIYESPKDFDVQGGGAGAEYFEIESERRLGGAGYGQDCL